MAFIRIDLAERIATCEVLLKRDAGSGVITTLWRDFSRREARADTPSKQKPTATTVTKCLQHSLSQSRQITTAWKL